MNRLIAARLIGVVVKYALFGLGTLLMSHNALTDDQFAKVTSSDTIETIAGILLTMAPVLWSMRGKVANLRELVAALHLAPGSSLQDIQEKAKDPAIAAAALPKS